MKRLLSGLVATAALCACEASPPPPNVLLYVIDTLRSDSLEPYGHPRIETPAAVRLASEGVLYERAYAQSSWTRPSITSILTGLEPDHHGVETREDQAPESLAFLAETFRERGYTTAAILTNPNVGRFFGFDQGYDEFIELYSYRGTGIVSSWGRRERSDKVTERAIEWIDGVREGPFFLFVLTTDPHFPYRPPEEFDRFPPPRRPRSAPRPPAGHFRWERMRTAYLGEIAFNDDSLGRLMDHLRRSGRYEHTVVALTSDHGEEFGEHGDLQHGRTLYEEVVRVPLILRGPGIPRGRRVATPVPLVDLHPTLLHAAGLPIPDGLAGAVLPPMGDPKKRMIYGRLDLDGRMGEMLIDPPWKLVSFAGTGGGDEVATRLFDLEEDPGERSDLRGDRPERVAAMEALLRLRAARSRGPESEQDAPQRGPLPDMPTDVRAGLEALGYLEPQSEEHPPATR